MIGVAFEDFCVVRDEESVSGKIVKLLQHSRHSLPHSAFTLVCGRQPRNSKAELLANPVVT